jgi:hypothetical protein
MSNYTLRIFTNGDGQFQDADFLTLDELYNSVFENWDAEAINPLVVKPGITLQSGYAVYDNATGLCINSINAAQVGLDKTVPFQQFGPARQ